MASVEKLVGPFGAQLEPVVEEDGGELSARDEMRQVNEQLRAETAGPKCWSKTATKTFDSMRVNSESVSNKTDESEWQHEKHNEQGMRT
jgi:hypothetical protein